MARALDAYRSKRDFRRTPEPGAALGRSGRQLTFVVQQHAARRLHWDLRLEWRGVLKSWAVTKEPVLDPAIKRLAVEVEDHPLSYGGFAGSIPEGQYGAGTVAIWDRGAWAPVDPARVDQDLAAGHLKFVLAGDRLQGGFALIRMKPKPKERNPGRNWLLIKERDDGGLPKQKAAAKAAPAGLLPMQHCVAAETPPSGDGWVHELKLDGYRLQCAIGGGAATLRTRSGLDWTSRFPDIVKAAATLPDCVLDGEAVALDSDGMPDFGRLQAILADERRGPVTFFAFDLLRDGTTDTRGLPQRERKERLRKLLARAGSDVVRYVEHFAAPGQAVLRSACQLSVEGVVSKRADRPYGEGRSGNWVKTKCRGNEEVVIGGWSLNRHGTGIGALLVGAWRDGRLAYLGRVGTGYGAVTSRKLLATLKPLERRTSPFEGRQPGRVSDVHWAKPDLVAQVAFAGRTEEGLLRQASFIALREDKPPREVEMAAPVAIPPPARQPATRGARLTHPERVLWPAAGDQPAITKAMLADYYARIAPLMLPELRGRPLSILRTPEGIGAETFFQRHAMRGLSPLLKQVTIAGQAKPYLMIEDEGGLLALAQIAATELHPWGAMAATPETPDRLVFDLDPGPGVDFPAIRAAARRLRAMLAAEGLTGFPRLSGGKGVHVVVPIAAPRRGAAPGWPEAKAFALALCRRLEKEDPAAFTTRMAKSARDGRIFLDYLRNDRLSTAIASWSPRARPGAPVARPLSWAALGRVARPDAFHLATLLSGRLPADPWRGFAEAAVPLPRLSPPASAAPDSRRSSRR
jgi:bifunctional non-homologous end joining protein LigD